MVLFLKRKSILKCYTNLGKEEKESKDKSLVRTYRILNL